MNNAPLTLILIASLGIVAVISLGVFFAIRPKFVNTDEHLAADVFDQQLLYSVAPPGSTIGSGSSRVQPQRPSNSNSPSASFPEAEPSPPDSVPGSNSGSSKLRPDEVKFGQSSKQNGSQEIVSTVELLDPLRVPAGFGDQEVRATAILLNPAPSSPPPPSSSKVSIVGDSDSKFADLKEMKLEKELDMHRYGKVVGLAYRKGKLYVASYINGNISMYKAESMNLLREYSCTGCHIYDLGVLSNGDLILSQGKYLKLTKLSNKTGAVVKEIQVPYSSKGIAISSYDEIFVLARDQNSVYVYDSNLKQLGVVPFENEKGDCNFISYGSDIIYISCEFGVYGINVQGKLVQTLKPSQGAYAIGIAVNNEAGPNGNGNIYVGQRGVSVIDIFDKTGKYLESVGDKKDSLWSDVVVGGKYAYVIEYITTMVKQYRLP